ncbi:hypothetical protein ABFT80_26320 [Mesorhizobium sp. SB112]|uniref:hypothetical protein n=1 Tax=Mesorhizobium sp. SB112 TaxID=3151853 RepID=UPI0032672F1F
MDVYFRAMKTAAEPVIGAQTADKWIAGAGDLKVGYVKDYFVTTVATFRQLPQERLQELVKAVGTPEMVAYAEQSTTAFIEALNAAADRLETSYAKELGNN